jgi:hypothetical protein
VFWSIADSHAAINAYLAKHNASPKPFVWTKSAETILAKLGRCPVPSVWFPTELIRHDKICKAPQIGEHGDATYRWGTMCGHHIRGFCVPAWLRRWWRGHPRERRRSGLGSVAAGRFARRSGEGHL